MKKRIIFIIVTIIIISGGFWWWQSIEQTTRDLSGVYSLESRGPKKIKKDVLFLTKNGSKKIVVNDLSVLSGYPKYDFDCGLNIITNLDDNLFFEEQPCGGDVFYSSVYILDMQNFDKGFKKIQDFLVSGIEGYINQDGSKIIGINFQHDRRLYLLDIKESIIPKNIYNAPDDKTFFFPSFYGDTSIEVQWKSNDELEIKEYLIEEINSIDPNNSETYPSAVNTQTLRL